MDPRLARARPESERPYAPGESEFRTDLERIRFAQSFSRLAEVTQVVSAGATNGVVHNRLTHTIKVTAVARAIAVRLLRHEDRELLRDLGGLDHVVVQAAANAHDLGHPPFGHLGERALDRLARERFGLSDGFEGNAQTFRILTEIEVHGPGAEGLNLTAAVRAAVLKYPWARTHWPEPHPTGWPVPPRGAGHGRGGTGAAKFSTYLIDLPEMQDALGAFPGLPPGPADARVLGDGPGRRHRVLAARRRGLPPLRGAAVLAGVERVPDLGGRPRRALRAERRDAGPAGTPAGGRARAAAAPPPGARRVDVRRGHVRGGRRRRRRRVRGRRAGRPVRRLDGERPGDLRLHLALDRPPRDLGRPRPRPGGAVRATSR